MFNLLTSPGTARKAARIFRTMTDGIRSVIAPAGLVADQAEPATVAPAAEPADVFTAEDMPPVADIEKAALAYDLACDNGRRADRTKRAAKKVLDKVPSGQFGRYRIFRTPSSRMTPDLAAITATYKANGWGPVPMKPCAPSLKVELVETAPAVEGIELLAGVAA